MNLKDRMAMVRTCVVLMAIVAPVFGAIAMSVAAFYVNGETPGASFVVGLFAFLNAMAVVLVTTFLVTSVDANAISISPKFPVGIMPIKFKSKRSGLEGVGTVFAHRVLAGGMMDYMIMLELDAEGRQVADGEIITDILEDEISYL